MESGGAARCEPAGAGQGGHIKTIPDGRAARNALTLTRLRAVVLALAVMRLFSYRDSPAVAGDPVAGNMARNCLVVIARETLGNE